MKMVIAELKGTDVLISPLPLLKSKAVTELIEVNVGPVPFDAR